MARLMKESGVDWIGVIPKNWRVKKIKNIFYVYSGATPKSGVEEYWDGDIKWITPADYKTEDKYVYGGKRCISKSGYDSCGTTLVDEYSIVFSKRAPIGTVAITKEKMCTNQGCLSCVNKESDSADYYYYLFSVATKEFEILGTGTTFKEISFDNFINVKVPVPEIDTQQKIAEFLDYKVGEINAIISKTKVSIDDYKKYKQSVITEAITQGLDKSVAIVDTDNIHIPKIPAHWKIKKMKYIFEIKKDIAGKEGYDILSITQKGIKIKDISKNEGQLAQNYSNYQLVDIGDFAMNHMDLLTGWVDISKYAGVTSPDYRVFRFIDATGYDADYYLYLMQMCYMNRIFYGLGQGVSNLGRWRLQADKFLNFTIPEPPLKEQQEIAKYLSARCTEIDALIAKKEAFVEEMEAYKKSLIYEYVTGKKEVL